MSLQTHGPVADSSSPVSGCVSIVKLLFPRAARPEVPATSSHMLLCSVAASFLCSELLFFVLLFCLRRPFHLQNKFTMAYSASMPFSFVMTLLLIGGVVSFPSEITSTLSPKPSNQKTNDVRDSPLEHIHVKQETGFDGKVRSIRFSLEPENDKKPDEKPSGGRDINRSKIKSPVTDKVETVTSSSNSKTDLDNVASTLKPDEPQARSTRMARTNEMSLIKVKSLRTKRSIEKALPSNNLNDLQAEEAKVFRPLFVYRQQVSRRLKLRNDKGSGSDRRRTLRKPNNYGNL